ncbi:hypothetical protein [Asticcacaulis sp. YBE204]|uniref:hypothetical protein n=1 Tax=Asticcacaulis sp. YBE204 TaxID=1282363 RepID=UPI0003F5EEC0|nr:hypothetical protein [Asticcacaulis sp. YBE204]
MLPPWEKYPELPKGRIGWRMGYGEDYMNAFWKWFSKLPDNEKDAYEQTSPEPEGWTGFYGRIRANPWL